jgi:hypothetical protein
MKNSLRSAIVSILVVATIAAAFVLLDDTHDQTILSGIKTFIPEIRFRATGGGPNSVGIVGPSAVPAPVTFALMPADGSASQCVVTDGSAHLSFATCVGGALTPVPTATPQTIPTALPTSTPQPTDTPLIDLLYSGKLNFGANAAGTPLGRVSINASATPAPSDRLIICTSGASAITYTMPAATASGRVLDVCKIDAGAGTCIEDGNASETLNGATTRTLSSQWDCDTCYDYIASGWVCRGKGT